MSTQSILFVMALEEEGVVLPVGAKSLITGIGKVNASMKLAQYLCNANQPVKHIVNLGSAGGVGLAKGQCFIVDRVIQFDMDVSPLGFDPHQTPFDPLDDKVTVNTTAIAHLGLNNASCFTSDRFVAGDGLPPAPALVDMEAYALAKTSAHFSVPFSAIKYVTDQADAQADQDWGAELESCGNALSRMAAAISTAAIKPIKP